MKKALRFFFIFSLSPLALFAQNFNAPPPVSVRTPAEWEEMQAVIVTWRSYPTVLTQIVKAVSESCRVVISCDNNSVATQAQNALTTAQVDLTRVEFWINSTNTVWVRDYGPNAVYANDVDSLMLVDWLYNRHNRQNDDILPLNYGAKTGLPVFSTRGDDATNLTNTGGNFMSDGMGTGFCSKLIFRNNDQSANGEGSNPNDIFHSSNQDENAIDEIMFQYMGISRYIKMDELPFDGIHHIDMHMKLLDEETLLVGQYPPGVSDGPQVEANIQYVLSNHLSSFGTPYKVVRTPMPDFYSDGSFPPYPGEDGLYPTYANALVVNRTVVLPKYNHALDAAALDTFTKYMPGYEITQVNCNDMIYAGGAIHCITKEIGVNDPLRIVHQALPNTYNDGLTGYSVNALIQHRSGIVAAQVFYTTDLAAGYQAAPMTLSATANIWEASIPLQNEGSTVYYYIEAEAQNGKVLTRPLTAPEGYWHFKVYETSRLTELQAPVFEAAYPNPSRSITCVPVVCAHSMRGNLALYNSLGQRISVLHEGAFPSGKSHYFLNGADYPAGAYTLRLEADGYQISQPLMIQ